MASTLQLKNWPAESAQGMLQGLAKHQHINFPFLFTGYESWVSYACDHPRMRVASWADISEVDRPSHFHQKNISAQ
jgi:hypothetical protein